MRRLPAFPSMRYLVALVALGLVLAAGPPRALARSVFAVGGLGEPTLEENARLRALGGAGVAEWGPTSFSLVSPASIADARFFSLEATMLATRRNISTESYGNESAYETAFPAVRIVVRLPQNFIVGGSYVEGTNAAFEIDRAESSGVPSLLHIEGSGGLNYARATLARRFMGKIRLGVDYEVVGGSFREEWARRFQSLTLVQNRDTLATSWDRLGRWRFGLQYGRGWLTLGGVYETARRLPLTYTQSTAGSSVTTKGSIGIPEGFAAGFNLKLGERRRVVGQYRRQNWNNESLESDLVDFRAEERYSIGFEKEALGFGSTLSKLPFRIGASYLCWPDLLPRAGAVDVTGGVAHLDEWAVSLGTGIRTPDKAGTVDLSLEGGRRGDLTELGASETFFRAAITVKISDETWR